MKDFYKRFVKEELDDKGRLLKFELDLKDNFNFSYDVIDEIAKIEPDKLAIHWVNENGEEHKFTFKELSEKSNQVANMMLAYGVKKGDMVMAVPRLWTDEDRSNSCSGYLSVKEERLYLSF